MKLFRNSYEFSWILEMEMNSKSEKMDSESEKNGFRKWKMDSKNEN